MFGLNEALMSFIRRQVGLRTDAADANGSLHAKTAVLGTPSHSRADNTVMGWLNSPVKSVQRGTLILSESMLTTSITINPVNTSKAIVVFTGFHHNFAATDDPREYFVSLQLISSTVVRAERGKSRANYKVTAPFQVIEFY